MSRPNVPYSDRQEHLWARRHLATAAAGLLPDADEERLQAHLAVCDDCRQSWNEQMLALAGEGGEADPDGERHLPAAMIARWSLATQTLAGLERETVRRHLERCADCRADLEALGQRPELAPVAVTHPAPWRSRSFGSGLAWGVGVTALAAVVAGLMFSPSEPPQDNSLLPWVAPVTLRGGDPATLELAADATGFTILAAVPRDLDARRLVMVKVVDPADTVLMTADVTPEMQAGHTISIVIRDQKSITTGDYRVIFSQTASDGTQMQRESIFRAVVADAD